MRKWFVIPILSMLVLSGFGTLATQQKNTFLPTNRIIEDKVGMDTRLVGFVDYDNEYLSVQLAGYDAYLMNPGQPMLPKIIKHYELPFGVTHVQAEVVTHSFQGQTLTKHIRPAPAPRPLSSQDSLISQCVKDSSIYDNDMIYPHDWYGMHIGCGLNGEGKRATHVTVNLFPVRYNPATGETIIAETFDITLSYVEPQKSFFPATSTYNLVVITPSTFSSEVQRLVDHKNDMGMTAMMMTTEDIYDTYTGVDKPEQIKYFIKDAIETHGITYVLLVGGLKSMVYAKPKDDINHGSSAWHLPVRYSNFQYDGQPSYNFTSGEPGYMSDLYYADIYDNGGNFSSWDSNGNGVFAEWSGDLRDDLDLYPDVAVGRLACRNKREAENVVDKIIQYESTVADPSWFKRIIVISGDGFLDQRDWDIQWDTTSLPDGMYTIYAQSTNPEDETGPIDEIQVTLDESAPTNITFNHDDHLNEALEEGYPAPPITEIVSVSNGNTLGNTDYTYTPTGGEAYCNDLYWWANISYIGGVLTIRGKSYDPKPYGNITDLSVWVENDEGTTVFSANRSNTETYYEGEWVVGEKLLKGRGGALVYMPEDYEKNVVFTSNGKWVDQSDVIEEFSNGYGLAYFSGHGSPGWWGDHYPGIPGNRRYGQVAGLVVTQASAYFPFIRLPVFPMRKLGNTDKLPVVCVGGCHNSMFSVSLIPTLLNRFIQNWMFTYGTPIPECWGWYMVKLPDTGAIATMGNTGYGWGSEGDVCTIGTGDGWINTEFFRQYGEEDQHILGMAYSQSITSYISHHKTFELDYWRHDYGWDGIDQKTVEQWELLGDPSLMIGGYS